MHPLLAARWSPRALDPAGRVDDAQLRALLDAARWAPSYGNTQPARWVLGRRGEPAHAAILDSLTASNRAWAHRAALLLVGIAVRVNEKGDIPLAEYGLGLAAQSLVLQAVAEGLVAHQMAGFDAGAVRAAFAVPPEATPLVAVAVGTLGDPTLLDADVQARELRERRRKPLGELAFGIRWGTPAIGDDEVG